ncbi:hypothetical protein E1264_03800 [Actinomadura sp. KC216]|uniref:hypothetical protein n=1 Tax=Actinomadura sp. KC216 TaxID=2530370 RepID=UPI00104B7C8A|nr:hypothetical protein [Actinomadura sp. KC216]TDB90939.1 hypothetical protein E1264_03800 [Actinomadura sp. KC216]
MPRYRVNLLRTTFLTAYVEAEDEDQAIDEALAEAPGFSAIESGWGSFGKWSADADEWLLPSQFYENYREDEHGPDVEPGQEGDGDDRW